VSAVSRPASPSQRRGPRLRNGPHGYGLVTKLLHWLTVAALLAQFAVGWAMDLDDGLDAADDRLDAEADGLEDAAEGRGEAAEDAAEAEIDRREDALDALEDDRAGDVFSDVVTGDAFSDGLSLPELHVVLGLTLIVLAGVRLVWRRTTPLPPWAEYLGAGERRLEAVLEQAMLALLVLVPASGLLLVAAGTGWVAVHVTAQFALLAAIALHVGLVLKHTVVHRDRQLARML
jgi:cytochrome b561